MRVSRLLVLVALLSVAGFMAWVAWAFDLEAPQLIGVLGVAVLAVVAAVLLFVRRRAGDLLALLAGLGGLVVAFPFWYALALSTHDATLERIAVVLPGGATLVLAGIDLLLVASVSARSQPPDAWGP